jgi:nitric oxide synthase oxygenase domain/subunit
LVAELEVVEDFLDVGRIAIEISLEVGPELLLARAGAKVAERELRRVVEGLAGRLAKRLILVGDARLVQRGLHVEDGLLSRLQHRIEAAQYHHRQDHITVFAPHIKIPQDVIRDAPDKVCDPVQITVTHCR